METPKAELELSKIFIKHKNKDRWFTDGEDQAEVKTKISAWTQANNSEGKAKIQTPGPTTKKKKHWEHWRKYTGKARTESHVTSQQVFLSHQVPTTSTVVSCWLAPSGVRLTNQMSCFWLLVIRRAYFRTSVSLALSALSLPEFVLRFSNMINGSVVDLHASLTHFIFLETQKARWLLSPLWVFKSGCFGVFVRPRVFRVWSGLVMLYWFLCLLLPHILSTFCVLLKLRSLE